MHFCCLHWDATGTSSHRLLLMLVSCLVLFWSPWDPVLNIETTMLPSSIIAFIEDRNICGAAVEGIFVIFLQMYMIYRQTAHFFFYVFSPDSSISGLKNIMTTLKIRSYTSAFILLIQRCVRPLFVLLFLFFVVVRSWFRYWSEDASHTLNLCHCLCMVRSGALKCFWFRRFAHVRHLKN